MAAAGQAREGASPQLGQALALFDAEVIKYHLRKNEAKRAIELSREALAKSDLAIFHNLLGKAYDLSKDPVLAAEEMQQAIRLDANQVNYYIDLAELFLRHNTPEPAEMVLLSAVRRFPKHGESCRLLGVARYGLGKTDEALDAFLQAIDAAPEMETAYASLETLLPSGSTHRRDHPTTASFLRDKLIQPSRSLFIGVDSTGRIRGVAKKGCQGSA